MAAASGRYRARRAAREEVAKLFTQPDNVYVVHYSCESFYDRTTPASPRITSIAVKHLGSGQTTSFSIHQLAERAGKLDEIEANYDELERQMLGGFFDFVRQRANARWIHWHMRDANYGFPAIEHRFTTLGGTPATIPDHLKTDMPVLLAAMYGHSYAPDPHMCQLADLNNVSKLGFLTGKEEAVAFENREYLELHQSTLRKANVIADLAFRMRDGTLKTAASWKDTYGVTVNGIFDVVTESVWWRILSPIGVVFSVGTLLKLLWERIV